MIHIFVRLKIIIFFFNATRIYREMIKNENPGFKVTEIAKRAGELWRGLGADDKKTWEGKAAQAKEQYMDACKKFEQNGGISKPQKRGKKDSKKPAKKSKKADEDDEDESD